MKINLIKRTAAAALCCVTLTACAKTDTDSSSSGKTSNPSAPTKSSSSAYISVPVVSGSVSDTPAESSSEDGIVLIPNFPVEDIPEEIRGIHDLSTGNYVYNANVTDTSNQTRYYSDFEWINKPRALWTSSMQEKPWGNYDAEGAVAYGKAHWADGVGLCAEFISHCLTSVKFTEFTLSSTSITLQLLHSGQGFGQFLKYNKNDHTISMPSYARPGDVVQIYCSYEGVMIHSLLMVGTDSEGRLRAVCHNMRNSGEYTFYIDDLNDPCYDCLAETHEVFFYHFYRDDDKGLPEEVANNRNIILWEERGYAVKESYDREAALEYANNHRYDGFGYYGASHTWDILKAGGLSIGYPNQSALFFQLLKSRLGQAFSLPVRADRTVLLPQYAEAGDIGFLYCPYDGIIISSFIVSGCDATGRMKTLSYDLLNDGESAFKVDSRCIGCGDDIKEVILFHFD